MPVFVFLDALLFFLRFVEFLLLVRAVMSWFTKFDSDSKIQTIVYDLTEFMLRPVRSLLNKFGMRKLFLDFSPIIVFFIIEFLKSLLIAIFNKFFAE
jgi:YggT family protein